MQLKKGDFLERLTGEDIRIVQRKLDLEPWAFWRTVRRGDDYGVDGIHAFMQRIEEQTKGYRLQFLECGSHFFTPHQRIPRFFCSSMSSQLYAVQHIRKMRGGSQAQFLRASDGNFYVTKFQNNPQHPRVLANEMLASRLGKWLGLPMPEVAVIEVSDWLIQNTPELRIETVGHSVPCQSGNQLGSRYPVDPLDDMVFDYLPESMFNKVRNAGDFPRMMVLDKWSGNADGRQAIFFKSGRQRKYMVQFIDQGYCFNAGEWTFTDLALHGVYYRNYVYAGVTGWESFEPALTKAEEADVVLDLWRCAECIPPEWYGYDYEGMQRLVEALYERRSKIRDLITAFRDSSRNPFPNWKVPSSCAVPQSTFAYEFQPL